MVFLHTLSDLAGRTGFRSYQAVANQTVFTHEALAVFAMSACG